MNNDILSRFNAELVTLERKAEMLGRLIPQVERLLNCSELNCTVEIPTLDAIYGLESLIKEAKGIK